MSKKGTVGIRGLKNQASRIVDDVRERGADYIITKRGKPVAVIRPWGSEDSREMRRVEAQAVLARLAEVAEQVAAAAKSRGDGSGAVSAVSQQRR